MFRKRSFLGAANGSALAWFTSRLRKMGNGSSEVYPAAQKRYLGKAAGNPDWWARLWMAFTLYLMTVCSYRVIV